MTQLIQDLKWRYAVKKYDYSKKIIKSLKKYQYLKVNLEKKGTVVF